MRELEYVGLLYHKDVTGADISPTGDTLAISCYGEEGWSYRVDFNKLKNLWPGFGLISRTLNRNQSIL